ncbi:MAG: Fic family protein [Eubacterium sp.]|nr:Fic family protein [Eubacterium sp.]
MYSYEKLEKKLADKDINRTALTHEPGISSRTIAKISKGEKLSQRTLRKIADYLSCDPDDLFQIISDNPILQRLREEKEARMPGGLYHELQIRMTYNSSHMEGSTLSEEQTRLIFETNTVDAGDGIPIDDILETVHHFRAIDYIIEHAEETLSEDFIKELHFILKHDTKDASLPWFAVGDYKKRANVVGGRKTARPKDVSVRMKELLAAYNAKKEVSVLDIITFHSDFEHIHPFQDGNGRVGRLISLKECLHWNIIPFIIEDSKKAFYYRGLSEWENEKGYLTDTCLDGQDTFRKLLDLFDL